MKRFLARLLRRAIEKGASDIHLKTGRSPYFRIDGVLRRRSAEPLSPEQMEELIGLLLTPEQLETLRAKGEVDLAYTDEDDHRFRINIFQQRGSYSIVMRIIQSRIPSFEALHLPPVVTHFAELHRGLVLITGTTGSGKSTTLAAILDHINRNRRCHIITLEDPIEYTHEDRKSVVNQREIGIDTETFSSALKAAMRQDPDVILVGEMRDLDTFQAAISAAETGHLVFSTLHTTNAMMTIDRIIDLFPTNQQDQIRSQLSLNLAGVMCQRLLERADKPGRVPICEVLLATPVVRKLIRENRVAKIPTAIQQGRKAGMQTFNLSLYSLLKRGLIDREAAMNASDNPAELELMLQGIELGAMRGNILGEGKKE